MASQNDAKIQAMLKQIETKKKEVSKIERFVPETSMTIDVAGTRYNLNTVTDTAKFIEITAHLISQKTNWDAANKTLGTTIEFSSGGFSLEQWVSDIQGRLKQVSLRQKKQAISEMEKKLESLMSNDLRTELELSKLEEILN